jgi:DNA-binding transcriptional LysR family regulator
MIPILNCVCACRGAPSVAQARDELRRVQHRSDLGLDQADIAGRIVSPAVLELRHLRYFVAVAEELNFSRAAERLHMAQPPLSVAIRQLEQEVGAELLQRTSREVTLTDAGRALLEGARRVLDEVERSVLSAQRAASGSVGTLRVGFSWSARFETLPTIGQAFRAEYPDVSLLTEEMWNARVADALRRGQIDLAVALCPEIAADLSYELVRSERVVALVTGSHARARGQAGAAVPLSSLADDGFLLFPRELAPRLYDLMVGMCRQAGFEPNVRQESFHTGWELQVLTDVPVVALVPESVTSQLPEGLVAVALSDPGAVFETALVWLTDDRSAVREQFTRVARAVYGTPSA